MHIYPYKPGSRSAAALAEALHIRQIRHEGSAFRGAENKTVINWGASELPQQVLRCRVLNKVDAVRRAGNKLHTFQRLQEHGVSIPAYTSSREQAITWLERGSTVVARRVLTGHSGAGIEILERGLDFVEAGLYTVYKPKTAEYRLHVVKARDGSYNIIDIQRKVKDPNRDVTDWKVRSHHNGFIFVRNDDQGRSYMTVCEDSCKRQAKMALQALGLDFGAIDVVYNKKANSAYILECNCAPGLEGHSIEVYANALRNL